jgi:hypothetical protein
MRYLPDNNLSYPVLIKLEDGSSGSGFFLNYDKKKQFLVTALHVLYRDEKAVKVLRCSKAKIISYDEDLSIMSPIELELDLTILPIKKNDTKDIVLVELASLEEEGALYKATALPGIKIVTTGKANMVNVSSESLKKFEEVLVSNEVFILGYPNSLSLNNNPQIEFDRPLLRKGIIAGKNLTKETIILDCPVYFGNSGGLAIQVEETSLGKREFKIIGVVSQYIPFVETLHSVQMGYSNVNFENSGYSVVVPTDSILDLASS